MRLSSRHGTFIPDSMSPLLHCQYSALPIGHCRTSISRHHCLMWCKVLHLHDPSQSNRPYTCSLHRRTYAAAHINEQPQQGSSCMLSAPAIAEACSGVAGQPAASATPGRELACATPAASDPICKRRQMGSCSCSTRLLKLYTIPSALVSRWQQCLHKRLTNSRLCILACRCWHLVRSSTSRSEMGASPGNPGRGSRLSSTCGPILLAHRSPCCWPCPAEHWNILRKRLRPHLVVEGLLAWLCWDRQPARDTVPRPVSNQIRSLSP